MDKRQKSRRKTIRAVEKEGVEEEVEKRRAAEQEEISKKPADIEEELKRKTQAEELKKKSEEDERKQAQEGAKYESQAFETLAMTEEEKAMLHKSRDEETKRREEEINKVNGESEKQYKELGKKIERDREMQKELERDDYEKYQAEQRKKEAEEEKRGDEHADKVNTKEIPEDNFLIGQDEDVKRLEDESIKNKNDEEGMGEKKISIDEDKNKEKVISPEEKVEKDATAAVGYKDTTKAKEEELIKKEEELMKKEEEVQKKEKENIDREHERLKESDPTKVDKEKEHAIKEEKRKDASAGDKSSYKAAGLIPTVTTAPGKKLKPITDEEVEKEGQTAGKGTVIDTQNVSRDSELGKARSEDQVLFEGPVWKKRYFFSCLWHERYFVLTRDGMLKYYNNKNKNGKGNINIATVRDLHRLDELNKKHPYKIMLRYRDKEDLMAFDDEPERNKWAAKLGEVRKNLL